MKLSLWHLERDLSRSKNLLIQNWYSLGPCASHGRLEIIRLKNTHFSLLPCFNFCRTDGKRWSVDCLATQLEMAQIDRDDLSFLRQFISSGSLRLKKLRGVF